MIVDKLKGKIEDAGWICIDDPEQGELPTMLLCCTPQGRFCAIFVNDGGNTDQEVLEFASAVINNKGLWFSYDGTAQSDRKLKAFLKISVPGCL